LTIILVIIALVWYRMGKELEDDLMRLYGVLGGGGSFLGFLLLGALLLVSPISPPIHMILLSVLVVWVPAGILLWVI